MNPAFIHENALDVSIIDIT